MSSNINNRIIIEIASANTGAASNFSNPLDDLINACSNEPYKVRKIEDSFENLKNCKLSDQEYQKLDKDTRDKIINSENDELIKRILNHCVKKCIQEENPRFMSIVADLLPELTVNRSYNKNIGLMSTVFTALIDPNKSYNNLVINLVKQLTYVKVPSNWCGKNKFDSTNENLWAYKFPDPKPSSSIFDRFEQIPRHSVTLCYVPLPGLCSYENIRTFSRSRSYKFGKFLDFMFPRNMSPFVRLSFSVFFETYEDNKASSKIFESPPFQAIVKYKWHVFARYRFVVWLASYLLQIGVFSLATSNITGHKQLMKASMALGLFSLVFFYIRNIIINVMNGTGFRFFIAPTNHILFLVSVLPIIVGLLEWSDNATPSVIRYPTIIIFWGGFVGFLCAASRNIGIFIIVIMQICRKILWLLVFLAIMLFICGHGIIVLYTAIQADIQVDNKERLTNPILDVKYLWYGFLGDYNFLSPWPDNFWLDLSRIIFSFFTSIVVLNIMIALVNNVYRDVLERAYTEWTIIRAQAIATIELYMLLPSERQNQDYFPWTIIYEARTEEVENWLRKLEADKTPTPWNGPHNDNHLQSLLDNFIR